MASNASRSIGLADMATDLVGVIMLFLRQV